MADDDRQTAYTSLSTLGAAAPPSPSEGVHGSGLGGTSFRPVQMLSSFAALLHPSAGEPSGLREGHGWATAAWTATTGTAAGEDTPLLAEQRRQGVRRSRKYVGGGCVCDPLEPVRPATNADGLATERSNVSASQDVTEYGCRLCDGLGLTAQPCFAYGQVGDAAGTTTKDAPSGMTLAALAQACFAVMSLLAATLASRQEGVESVARLNGLQMLAWQGLTTALMCTVILLASGRKDMLLGPKGSRIWMWARAACSATSGVLFVIAAQGIPIADLVTIVYLAPLAFNLASHILFASRHPFRAQLVSLSLWLGVVLMVQPGFLQGAEYDSTYDDQAVAAAPLDLPALAGTGLAVDTAWAYGAAATSAVFLVLSLALLDSRPSRVSAYHSMLSSALLSAVASGIVNGVLTQSWPLAGVSTGKTAIMMFAILCFAFFARLLQEVALLRTGACQLGLISFLQPLLSTGLNHIFPDIVGDVLQLAGCLLIAVNLAWIASPSNDEDEEPYG